MTVLLEAVASQEYMIGVVFYVGQGSLWLQLFGEIAWQVANGMPTSVEKKTHLSCKQFLQAFVDIFWDLFLIQFVNTLSPI